VKMRMLLDKISLVLVAAGALALGAGCDDSRVKERKQLLGDMARLLIVPTYDDFATTSGALKDAATAFEAAPTVDGLKAVREAWRKARAPWKRSETFNVGPAETQRINPAVDSFPPDPARIEEVVAATTPLADSDVEALAAGQRGFLALEVLLFDPARSDEMVVADLAASTRRRQVVTALATNIANRAAQLRDAWKPAFTAELESAGSGSTTYTTQKQALDALMNRMIYLVDKVATVRLARPLGIMMAGTMPLDEEAPRSDNSLVDLTNNLKGVEAEYLGTYAAPATANTPATPTISTLVARAQASADQHAREQIADALAKLQAVPQPMRLQLAADPAPLNAAYEAVRLLRTTLTTEVAGVLGVTLKFGDNDGD